MKDKKILVLSVIVQAGKILLESGAEISRVEDTMIRIGKNSQFDNIVIFVTPTGIFASLSDENYSQMASIHSHNINLDKIRYVNELSRNFAEQKITITTFREKLAIIEDNIQKYSILTKTLGAGILSSALIYTLTTAHDSLLVGFAISSIAYLIFLGMTKITKTDFLSYGIAAFFIGIAAVISVNFGISSDVDSMIVGCVMPFVPGVKIVNAFSDGIKGHSISSVSFALQAILTACSIGFGIASALILFRGI